MSSSSLPTQIAETVQAAHVKRHPDPQHDNAPATAADSKAAFSLHDIQRPREYDDVTDEYDDGDDDDGIPVSVLRPAQRKQTLPPLPDLRFEQSYLRSISAADTWWKVVLITTRDQVVLPLTQGLVWNLLLCGWQHWNRAAQLHGNTAGARVRRWWYGVNNWVVPKQQRSR